MANNAEQHDYQAEEQKHIISARLELLKKGSQQDLSATSDVIEKVPIHFS